MQGNRYSKTKISNTTGSVIPPKPSSTPKKNDGLGDITDPVVLLIVVLDDFLFPCILTPLE